MMNNCKERTNAITNKKNHLGIIITIIYLITGIYFKYQLL